MAKRKKELDVLVKVDFSQLKDLQKSLSDLGKTIDSLKDKAKNLNKSFTSAFNSMVSVQNTATKQIEDLSKKRINIYKKESKILNSLIGKITKSVSFSGNKSFGSSSPKDLLEDYKLKAIDLSTKIRLTPKTASPEIIKKLNDEFLKLKSILDDLESSGVIDKVFKMKEISKFIVMLNKLYIKLKDYGRSVEKIKEKEIIGKRNKDLLEKVKIDLSLVNKELTTMSFNLKHLKGEDIKRITKEVGRLKKKLLSLADKNIISKSSAISKISRLEAKLNNITKAFELNSNVVKSWWERFGEVSVGFTLVYRAMNMAEDGIRSLSDFMKGIIEQFDETVNAIYKSAMMYQFFGNSTLSFSDSVKRATNVVYAMKLAMIDTTASIDDVTAGLDELAQHGVFITDTSKLKAYALLFGFIGQIATTTGSTMKQVRQEIQSLFEGAKRPGNIFLKFVSSLEKTGKVAKGTTKALQDATTSQEAFKVILEQVIPVIEKANEKLLEMSSTAAKTRFKNIISLLGEFGLRVANIAKTGDQAKNVFAQIYNNASKELFNTTNLEKYRTVLGAMTNEYRKLVQSGVSSSKAVEEVNKKYGDMLHKSFSSMFTEKGKQIAQSMAVIFMTVADVFERILKSVGGVINYLATFITLAKILYDTTAPIVNVVADIGSKMLGIFILYKSFILLENIFMSLIFSSIDAFKKMFSVVKSINSIIASITSLTTTQVAVIGGVVAAITAVLTVSYLVYKVWKKNPEAVKDFGKAVVLYIGKAVNQIMISFINLIGFLGESMTIKLPAIGMTAAKTLAKSFINAFYRIELGVAKVLNKIGSNLKSFLRPLASFFGDLLGVSEDTINKALNSISIVSDKTISELEKKVKDTAVSFSSISKDYETSVKSLWKYSPLNLLVKGRSALEDNVKFYNKELSKLSKSVSVFKIEFKKAGKELLSNIPILGTITKKYKDVKNNLQQVFLNLAGWLGYDPNKALRDLLASTSNSINLFNNLLASAKSLYETMDKLNFKKLTVSIGDLSEVFSLDKLKKQIKKYYSELKKNLFAQMSLTNNEQERMKIKLKIGMVELEERAFDFNTSPFVKKFRSSVKQIKKSWDDLQAKMTNKSIKGDDALSYFNNLKKTLSDLIETAKSGKEVDFSHFGVKDLEDAEKLLTTLEKNSVKVRKYVFDTNDFVNKLRNSIANYKKILSDLSNSFSSGNITGSEYINRLKDRKNSLEDLIKTAKSGKIVDFSEFGAKDLKEANNLLNEYREKLKEINDEMSSSDKFKQVVNNWFDLVNRKIDYAKQIADSTKNIFDGFVNTLGDALYDAFTGKLKSFKDYTKALTKIVLAELSKIIAKYLILKSISFFTSLSSGSSTGTSGSASVAAAANGNVFKGGIKFFANGGIVNKPTLGIVGEGDYNEAIVPLPDGRHIPAVVKQPNNQPAVNNIVVQVQALDAQSFVEYEDKTGVISSIIKKAIAEGMMNNGEIRNSIKSYL